MHESPRAREDTGPRRRTSTSAGARPHLVIAGASGVVGRHLIERAAADWRITILTRRIDGSEPPGVTSVEWRPNAARTGDEGHLDDLGRLLDGAGALVNLAGASIDRGRFGPEHRRQVLESRVDATRTLVRASERAGTAPAVWFQASAVGIYGDRGDEPLTEASPIAEDFFLTEVCRAWEATAAPAARRSRLVVGRQGMVLARDAAAWKKLVLPVRLGVGGPLGSGRQWWSWIHADDLAAAMLHLIEEPHAADGTPQEGVYALTAPEPARQIDVTRAAARILKRPAIVPVPAFALRLAVGGLADMLLLPSARLLPVRLMEEPFTFRHRTIRSAAEALLKD